LTTIRDRLEDCRAIKWASRDELVVSICPDPKFVCNLGTQQVSMGTSKAYGRGYLYVSILSENLGLFKAGKDRERRMILIDNYISYKT